jgi:hypothetical protein
VKKSLLLLPLVLIASALALAACGGGGSSSGGGEAETAITEVIEKSVTSTEPSKCTEFQTQEFNEQDQNVEGAEALSSCEETVEEESEAPAESVDVSNINVEGESATAEAAVKGSALNGQTVELEMVEEEGSWKLNQFLSFTKFDGGALAEGLQAEFEREGEVEPELAECVSEAVGNAPQAQVEELAFEGKVEVIEEIAEGCEG